MLPSIAVAFWRARRLSPMHPASTVLHRSVPARFPAPPRMGSASLALTHEDSRTAQRMLEQAVEIDPGFAEAHAWLAMSYHFGWLHWDQEPRQAEALAAVLHAISRSTQKMPTRT
jgi:hypothetical protein